MIAVGHLTGISHRDSYPRLWMTVDRAISEKFNRTTWHSEWIPRLEKFSEKSLWAFSSRNRTWRGVGSEEDVPKRRGFRDGVDLRLGAVRRLSKRERGRETENIITTQHRKIEKKGYVCMKNAWTCDVLKEIASWVQPNPNLATHNFQHITSNKQHPT